MNRMLVRTRVAGLGVLVFALSAQVASAGHYTWTTSGPEAGLIFQIGVNPADETRVNTFAGYFGGYFFQSENGGASWSFVPGSASASASSAEPRSATRGFESSCSAPRVRRPSVASAQVSLVS